MILEEEDGGVHQEDEKEEQEEYVPDCVYADDGILRDEEDDAISDGYDKDEAEEMENANIINFDDISSDDEEEHDLNSNQLALYLSGAHARQQYEQVKKKLLHLKEQQNIRKKLYPMSNYWR